MEEIARFFLEKHKDNPMDYVERFRKMTEEYAESEESENKSTEKVEKKMPLCPKCGAPMILRVAKKGSNAGGKFYGCSKFPQCKGIRQID